MKLSSLENLEYELKQMLTPFFTNHGWQLKLPLPPFNLKLRTEPFPMVVCRVSGVPLPQAFTQDASKIQIQEELREHNRAQHQVTQRAVGVTPTVRANQTSSTHHLHAERPSFDLFSPIQRSSRPHTPTRVSSRSPVLPGETRTSPSVSPEENPDARVAITTLLQKLMERNGLHGLWAYLEGAARDRDKLDIHYSWRRGETVAKVYVHIRPPERHERRLQLVGEVRRLCSWASTHTLNAPESISGYYLNLESASDDPSPGTGFAVDFVAPTNGPITSGYGTCYFHLID
ncbi:hypothetical protein T439DRAFT_355979 [Meredithblackwellia eburnea MCA 4105]